MEGSASPPERRLQLIFVECNYYFSLIHIPDCPEYLITQKTVTSFSQIWLQSPFSFNIKSFGKEMGRTYAST